MELFKNSRRIRIDYKDIMNYQQPFCMILKVNKFQGTKTKYDVWEVRNGVEAEEIRKKYKEAGRSTSYWAFYNNLNELLKENDSNKLSLNPRIRGKNKKEKNKLQEMTSMSVQNVDKNLARQIKVFSVFYDCRQDDIIIKALEEFVNNHKKDIFL